MMRYSFVLTVQEGKKIIALGLLSNPVVRGAINHGQVLLKGGTTVSAFSEALGGPPMNISGRITPGGFRSAGVRKQLSTWMVWRNGKSEYLPDADAVISVARTMGPGDAVITGANIFDHEGRAAMMVGSPLGGERSWVVNLLYSEGIPVFIAMGMEKLCISVPDAVQATGRQLIDSSQGMAVGLLPLYGQVFNESDALKSLADVHVNIIGRGGINGAEGGTSFVIEGEEAEIEKILTKVKEVKGAETSGSKETLISCENGGGHCKDHLGCMRSRHRIGGQNLGI